MIKITAASLAEKFGISRQAVVQWFERNDKSLKDVDNVVDYVMIKRLSCNKLYNAADYTPSYNDSDIIE